MTYACEKCIHRHPLGGCLVPSNLGYVERCKHFEKPKQTQPMTNEEYIRSCTFKELAEILTETILDEKRFRMTVVGGVSETKHWLKEIRK